MNEKRFTMGYKVYRDNLTGERYDEVTESYKICDLLNNLHEENQLKLEMIDAFIRGLEDEKGIVPEDREFQCRMNHTIKVLKELKRDMLHPTEFKSLKEVGLDD